MWSIDKYKEAFESLDRLRDKWLSILDREMKLCLSANEQHFKETPLQVNMSYVKGSTVISFLKLHEGELYFGLQRVSFLAIENQVALFDEMIKSLNKS